MKKLAKLALGAALAAALAACGGGGGSATTAALASADTVAPANATTVAAVSNVPLTFATGVPEFGTAGPTTVTFNKSGADAGFGIATSSGSASGNATFGSCIFQITASTFSAPSPLALGQTIRVNPCNFNASTNGATANGAGSTRALSAIFGSTKSSDVLVTITVSPTGEVTVNGVGIGTVTVVAVTGGG